MQIAYAELTYQVENVTHILHIYMNKKMLNIFMSEHQSMLECSSDFQN